MTSSTIRGEKQIRMANLAATYRKQLIRLESPMTTTTAKADFIWQANNFSAFVISHTTNQQMAG